VAIVLAAAGVPGHPAHAGTCTDAWNNGQQYEGTQNIS